MFEKMHDSVLRLMILTLAHNRHKPDYHGRQHDLDWVGELSSKHPQLCKKEKYILIINTLNEQLTCRLTLFAVTKYSLGSYILMHFDFTPSACYFSGKSNLILLADLKWENRVQSRSMSTKTRVWVSTLNLLSLSTERCTQVTTRVLQKSVYQ